jgi:hypothetical protein
MRRRDSRCVYSNRVGRWILYKDDAGRFCRDRDRDWLLMGMRHMRESFRWTTWPTASWDQAEV